MKPITKVLFSLLILILAGAIAQPSLAQEKTFATQGVVELAGSMSWAKFTPVANGEAGDATSVLSFGPEIAYFLADGFEVGFNPGMSILPGLSVIIPPSPGENTTVAQLFVYPAYNYHLPSSTSFLFLEVPIGYTSMSSGGNQASGFSWGVKAGVKVVATGHMLVTVFGEYMQIALDPQNLPPGYESSGRTGFDYLTFGVAIGGFF